MPKPRLITLGRGLEIPILHEDRSVLAIDKPAGWILAPTDWDRTARNLPLALASSIRAGDFWARSRNLKSLRPIHRLDAETTGVLLFSRSAGGISVYSRLFESRTVRKVYYAVVEGMPPAREWVCQARLGPDPRQPGRMKVDPRQGKDAETQFFLEQQRDDLALVRAQPVTGRTHQIRIHLLESGLKILGDAFYGSAQVSPSRTYPMALRAAEINYADPFTRRSVRVLADMSAFFEAFGFTRG